MLTSAQAAAIATSAFVRPAVQPAAPSAPPSAEASSSDRAPYRTVVEDEDEETGAAQRDLDTRTPGFATAVDLEQEAAAAPADALPELIARTPGATVRSVGGLGQFGAVSLRGSSPQQVAMFLDGVPLTDSVAGVVDLSDIPLDGLGRLEIYRGYVPVAFGSAAIGGAIDLRGAPAWNHAGLSIRGGYGSFGARETRVAIRGPLGRRQRSAGALTVGYAGARGNFRFLDDGGTPDLSGDDRFETRTNNDYDRVAVYGRFDHRKGAWRFAVQPILQYKDQGIPGPAAAQSSSVRLQTFVTRLVTSAKRYEVFGPGGRIEWRVGLGLVHQVYRDPDGEVGIGLDDQRQLGVDIYLSPRMRVPLWHGAYLGLVADQRIEHLSVDQRAPTVGTTGDARRSRYAAGAGLELEQFVGDGRWKIVPTVRVDALDSRFAVPEGQGEQDDEGRRRTTIGFAPRIGSRLRLWSGVELRASGGRYFRPPTIAELFGNRGYLLGNEGLRPERGEAIDGGIVVDRRVHDLNIYASAAGFATWSDDLIQWINAGAVVRPENVEGARIRGLETSLALQPETRWLTLHANYTLLDTRNDSRDPAVHDKPLPGRPRHEFFGQTSAGYPISIRRHMLEPRARYTVDILTDTTLDPAGRLRFPPRVLQGLGAELHFDGRVHLSVEVRNLLNVRTTSVVLQGVGGARPRPSGFQDFLGYPLPGRSVWGSVRVDLWGGPR